MMRARAAAFAFALGLVAAGAGAEPLAPGSAFPTLSMLDQHGQPHSIDADVRLVLFSRDMDGGGLIRDALADRDADYLTARRAVYVADVSAMPGLIRRMIALPRMRKRAYPVLLDLEGDQTADFPHRDGEATVLVLAGGTVAQVSFAASPAEVAAALAAAAGD